MSHLQRLPSLAHVAVCGGTHGNEMSGVYLVKHWLSDPSELHRSTFQATPFLGNPRAVQKCVRYIGRDLNRTFIAAILNSRDPDTDSYEVQRAQEINQTFGPKGSSQAYEFMFDLHNTTANMGCCLIVASEHCLFTLHMCNYIQKQPKGRHCSILLSKQNPEDETYSVCSVGKNGLAIEVGPQPQGVARADLLTLMRSIVTYALDFIELFNKGDSAFLNQITGEARSCGLDQRCFLELLASCVCACFCTLFPACDIEAYKVTGVVDFPRYPNGEISAVIHPDLQDKDFQPLKPGNPIFQTFTGEDILYDGEDTTYPVFINEAAYYEKKTAFLKTEKHTVSLPMLQKKF